MDMVLTVAVVWMLLAVGVTLLVGAASRLADRGAAPVRTDGPGSRADVVVDITPARDATSPLPRPEVPVIPTARAPVRLVHGHAARPRSRRP